MNNYDNFKYFLSHDINFDNIRGVMINKQNKKWRVTRPLQASCFYFILKGEYIAHINGKSLRVKENDLLFLPFNTDYKAESVSPQMEHCHIYFDIPQASDGNGYFDIPHIYNLPGVKRLFLNIISDFSSGSLKHMISCKKNLYEICEIMLDEEIKKNRSLSDYYALKASIDYLENNYNNPDITVDYLANLSNYTPAHFINLFKKLYNTTPQKHLTRLRIKEAKELLIYSSYSIIEIAGMVGYSGPAYFSAAFKAVAGCSPMQYRKNHI